MKIIPVIGVGIVISVKIKNVYQNVIINNVYVVLGHREMKQWETAVIVKNAIRENVRNL